MAAAWGVRLLIAYTVLSALTPAPPQANLGPPQTVITTQPRLCVHTRLTDEVETWKIQQSLAWVREMGAPTIVELFPWAYIEGSPDNYSWHSADRIVEHARNQGLHVIARLGLVPGWAQTDETRATATLNTLPPESYNDFAQFTADFAARYAGTVDELIIWNEPNLAFEWGFAQVSPSGYADLLRAVYERAHAANPNVVILAAPLAPTLEPEGSPNGLNDLLYLEQLYQAGAAPYFDALAVHTYGFNQPPEAEPAFDQLNFRRVELIHDIMTRYDAPNKPLAITETGWNDHPRWSLAVPPAQRIAYTLDAFAWADEHWPWLSHLCIWVFRYPVDTTSYPDNFTLVTADFQRKPIYYALQAFALGTGESEDLWLPPPAG